jgi:hypothetical protein
VPQENLITIENPLRQLKLFEKSNEKYAVPNS